MGTNRTTDIAGIQAGIREQRQGVDLSVCIVTYKARACLRDCLRSLYEHTHTLDFEVIVVDNGSEDGVAEMLREEYPEVRFIQNDRNTGYTLPMNQSLRAGSGRYLLQLNPDTLIRPAALDRLVQFLEENSTVGICGPKVLNKDGTLQKACRRGEPRPLAVISYFTGLARMFPQSKRFGEYLMTYMDEDETHPVASLSGSCMLIRREVVDQIGYLDERFFAYQEDADYCYRARQAGWGVYYLPTAQIIHFGGQGGSRVQPYRSIVEWHKSYFRYYRKHLAKDYFILFNGFYYIAMGVKFGLALLVNSLRKEKFAGPRRG
jgi:GT2 family glycosyltransferase